MRVHNRGGIPIERLLLNYFNRYITERKSSLHNWSGQICPYSLRATFQRELMDLEEGVYFFSKLY